jgi:predicted transcriptional regulator
MVRPEHRSVLGPLEQAVMDTLWRSDTTMSVRQVLGALNANREPPLAYTTVMTVLTRLTERGVLGRVRVGRGYQYQAAATSAAEIAVRRVLHDFGDAALASFVDQLDADEVLRARLRRMVEES